MKRIAEDIKTGEFKQAYLLYGDEEYLCNKYKNMLLKALDCTEDSMNFTKYQGKNTTEENIIESCETMPFFADRRVVLVEDTGFFKEKKEKLADYAAMLPEYITLIFCDREIDKRSRLYKNISKYDRVIEFKRADEKLLTGWILVELKKNGKVIKKSTLEYFLNGAGTDMNFISCELEKLIGYTGERQEITLRDVQQVCTVQTENRIFQMIEDASAGRREKALQGYYDLLLLKEAPMKILVLLERQYDLLLRLKELSAQGLAEKLIAEKLKLHPYVVKKNMPLARKYSVEDLKMAVKDYVEADEDIKTGRLTDRMAVEMLLIKYSK